MAAAITPRTKVILLNSPANPTGAVAGEAEVRALAELAAEAQHRAGQRRDLPRVLLRRAVRRARREWNDQTLVIDGFSKTYGMTGWRLGFVHGPAAIIDKLTMLQQYTFVCAPQPLQWAARRGAGRRHERSTSPPTAASATWSSPAWPRPATKSPSPAGRSTCFPKCPAGHRRRVRRPAIENELLIIPGNIFSARDTHFRISYAASDATIERGLEVLRKLSSRRDPRRRKPIRCLDLRSRRKSGN